MKRRDVIDFSVVDSVATLTIDREKNLNALNREVLGSLSEMLDELAACCGGADSYSEIRAVVLTGRGEKAFVAGADIKEMQSCTAAELRSFIELGQTVMRKIESLALPVVAAVNGFAIGGGLELALACDLIAASDKAKLGLAEVGLGLIPGFGGTQRLSWRAGIGVAKRIALTGESVSAEEAHRLGFVDWVFPATELRERVAAIATGLRAKSPLGIAAAKRAIQSGFAPQRENGLSAEVSEFLRVFQSEDASEGLAAFAEKRPSNFRGR